MIDVLIQLGSLPSQITNKLDVLFIKARDLNVRKTLLVTVAELVYMTQMFCYKPARLVVRIN